MWIITSPARYLFWDSIYIMLYFPEVESRAAGETWFHAEARCSRKLKIQLCLWFESFQSARVRRRRATGWQQRVAERKDAPTQSTRPWSWRRSFCSTCIWPESAAWRSAGASTWPTGRSRSGFRTAGWSWRKWTGRTASANWPQTSPSRERACSCPRFSHWVWCFGGIGRLSSISTKLWRYLPIWVRFVTSCVCFHAHAG